MSEYPRQPLRRVVRLFILLLIAAGGYYAWQTWGPLLDDPWVRADIAWHTGMSEYALSNYYQAVIEQPNHPRVSEAHYKIAECHHDLGEHDEARAAYVLFLQLYPTDAKSAMIQTRLEYYEMVYLK